MSYEKISIQPTTSPLRATLDISDLNILKVFHSVLGLIDVSAKHKCGPAYSRSAVHGCSHCRRGPAPVMCWHVTLRSTRFATQTTAQIPRECTAM
eukprot:6180062-Pleurochrysis_carterae.AAC.1